jgi:hypothetical protein
MPKKAHYSNAKAWHFAVLTIRSFEGIIYNEENRRISAIMKSKGTGVLRILTVPVGRGVVDGTKKAARFCGLYLASRFIKA